MKFKLVIILFSSLALILSSCNSEKKKTYYSEGSSENIGRKLFVDMACNACHTTDGSLKLGPSLQGQYGKEILHTDGTVMIIDDEYIKESIIYPLKHIVEGYTPIMPSYNPILNDSDIKNIIAYIKTIN